MFALLTQGVAGLAFYASAADTPFDPVLISGPPAALTRTISYRDLDLTTRAGERALHSRINRAVNGLCFEVLGPSRNVEEDFDCRAYLWQQARPQLKGAVGVAMAAKGGKSVTIIASAQGK